MFTGIVKDIGTVTSVTPNSEGVVLKVSSKLCNEIAIDDSVAINGVCQTATKVTGQDFEVQTIHVSLEKTTLGTLKVGDEVNLELALRPVDRLGGHFVQGHVNGTAALMSVDSIGDNYNLWFELPEKFSKYLIKEGSIAIDGISLTIADLREDAFCVSIIPHTWENTILSQKNIGDHVNIEVDMIAKYIEKLMSFTNRPEKISSELLYRSGFLS